MLAALDEVPNEAPYVEWKEAALTTLLHISNAVIAYDDGLLSDDLLSLRKGNRALGKATDAVADMNAAAESFSSDC